MDENWKDTDNTENEQYEETDETIRLTDDSGNETEYEFLDRFELDGSEYVVLLPTEQSTEESDEVVILKVESKDDEESLVSVDNEAELDKVFNEFKMRCEDEYDFIDE
jgi:uncharacterized protein YrzB (UPF0473 family)